MGDPDWLLSSLSSWWDTPSQQREHEGSLGTEQSAPRIWFFFPWTRITVKLELAVDSGCWVLCAKISQQNNTCEFCRANTRSQLQFPDLQRVELEGKKPLYMNSVLDVESQRCSSTRKGAHYPKPTQIMAVVPVTLPFSMEFPPWYICPHNFVIAYSMS